MATAPDSDVLLVMRSAEGNRPAFARIVERYQSLVCSVAYSATGSLSRSEDVAQETFLAAWRSIANLREPERLRFWLCSIARNLSRNAHREGATEPAHAATPIDAIDDLPADDEAPIGQAMREEEQALLWRAVGRLPDLYREPLVMFYREEKSIAQVAGALELGEDAVRQRLTRGRRLLHDEVAAFVEGALARSAPGKAFTLAVMAALPAYGVSTSAAAAMLATQAGSAKSAGGAALALGLAGPAIGAAGTLIGLRIGLDAAESRAERALVKRFAFTLIAASVVFSAALIAWIEFAPQLSERRSVLSLFLLVAIGWSAWFARVAWRATDAMRAARRDAGGAWFRESRSSITWLGLPLWHVYFGVPPVGAPAARGWIAFGDRAIGGLFAFGNFALAPIAVGTVSVGGIVVGAVAIGVVPIGAAAFGVLALAGASAGVIAMGGYAVAWKGAVGGLAVARDFAAGGFAVAAQANDIATRDFFAATLPSYTFPLMLGTLAVLTLVPAALFAWCQRRALRRAAAE